MDLYADKMTLHLTQNQPHKNIKSLHTARLQLPPTTGQMEEVQLLAKTQVVTNRTHTEELSQNLILHDSIICRNVLRYGWMSSE